VLREVVCGTLKVVGKRSAPRRGATRSLQATGTTSTQHTHDHPELDTRTREGLAAVRLSILRIPTPHPLCHVVLHQSPLKSQPLSCLEVVCDALCLDTSATASRLGRSLVGRLHGAGQGRGGTGNRMRQADSLRSRSTDWTLHEAEQAWSFGIQRISLGPAARPADSVTCVLPAMARARSNRR
jgi:hypothetical protein